MAVLVTGGAGYIGNFMTRRLLDDGEEVVVIDSLERGHIESLDKRITFLKGTLLDRSFLKEAFIQHSISAVIHFAGYISVAESVKKPSAYITNNVIATLNLLDEMINAQVNKIVFASTAAVYGNPTKIPIPEDHPKNPESPYGDSKLMVEKIFHWYEKANGLRHVTLRFFNASGAALDGSMGEDHQPETHIIPNAILAAINKTPFTLYGKDYDTPDGTCIRDYIHVLDLAQAHILALKKISEFPGGYQYNVGTGKGYSNKEVVEMVEKVSGEKMNIVFHERRPGDSDKLIADPSRIFSELSFKPQYSDLETIVSSAWKWHTRDRR
ncbi:MAG: UDP-glucose 4-epimerase GalE [Candidatus Levybacteria bacterium]|nr:UDP-glucose 4-epimerase GalE [Candidatus Levybacteria bacterium]